jgi:hypothetical protein
MGLAGMCAPHHERAKAHPYKTYVATRLCVQPRLADVPEHNSNDGVEHKATWGCVRHITDGLKPIPTKPAALRDYAYNQG